jgi:integrase/recombinase XerD
MTRLRQAAADYLQLRRGLGFSLVRDEKLLSQFLGWLEDQDTDTITVTQALAWAQLPGNAMCALAAAADGTIDPSERQRVAQLIAWIHVLRQAEPAAGRPG